MGIMERKMETAVYGQLEEVGLRLLARNRFCGHSGLSWRAGLKEDGRQLMLV